MSTDRPTRLSEWRLLLLSMYPLDQGLWGPTVRITNLSRELAGMVRLDVISGYRAARRAALARYALSGRLRGLAGIYVESSSALPSETDLAFLALARLLRIPTLTYIRDAYQLFPEYYASDSSRRWLSARAFRPAMRMLAAASSRIAVPSSGLAQAIFGKAVDAVVLPPGSRAPLSVEPRPDAAALLFVGNGRARVQGAPQLIEAVGLARSRGTEVELIVVSRPGEEPPGPLPPHVRVLRAQGDEIDTLLPDVVATVVPRQRNAYNDMALPVKLFDYLALGRPLLVTDCRETARVVREAGCGLVVGDASEKLADGIVRLMAMDRAERARLGEAARTAARAASWEHRAHTILETLGIAG